MAEITPHDQIQDDKPFLLMRTAAQVGDFKWVECFGEGRRLQISRSVRNFPHAISEKAGDDGHYGEKCQELRAGKIGNRIMPEEVHGEILPARLPVSVRLRPGG